MAFARSWVDSANDPQCDFPIQNLPYGVFRGGRHARIGVAIGDQILDLWTCASEGLLAGLPDAIVAACTAQVLNLLMALGPEAWSALRRHLIELLSAEDPDAHRRERLEAMLVPQRGTEMLLPAQIGDYTDFYASIHHAARVGKLFRPDNPLLPNYKYVPIGYHGRSSSIVVSGQEIRRPKGQIKPVDAAVPEYRASCALDYELEVGAFIGPGNEMGEPIAIQDAEKHIFGLCLLNDWSARDVQSWEYQPLGPFLAKNFATTISPWLVPMEALAPYRVPAGPRNEGDPPALPHLALSHAERDAIDVTVEVHLQSRRMREQGMEPMRVSHGNLRDLYWSLGQLVAHHTSSGCNLRPGDLRGTGTISGPEEGTEGCLLEMKHRQQPLTLPTGEVRSYLEDGDQVTLRGFAGREGWPRVGFGSCVGTVRPAE